MEKEWSLVCLDHLLFFPESPDSQFVNVTTQRTKQKINYSVVKTS